MVTETLSILIKQNMRLHGIDAPEINQQCKVKEKSYACGLQSKIFLESLAQGKKINVNKKILININVSLQFVLQMVLILIKKW